MYKYGCQLESGNEAHLPRFWSSNKRGHEIKYFIPNSPVFWSKFAIISILTRWTDMVFSLGTKWSTRFGRCYLNPLVGRPPISLQVSKKFRELPWPDKAFRLTLYGLLKPFYSNTTDYIWPTLHVADDKSAKVFRRHLLTNASGMKFNPSPLGIAYE